MNTPTTHQYAKYQKLYNYFNEALFQNELPFCLLVLSRAAAQKCGYFYKDRWQDQAGNTTHEISLNPNYLAVASNRDICQTLVHEMCHLWQQVFGKPSRAGYHNKEWGAKMQEVGLMPSDTGTPGGKTTGQQMADYPIPKGLFLKAFYRLPKGLLLPFKAFSEEAKYLELLALIQAATVKGEDFITINGEQIPVATVPLKKKPKKISKLKYTCPNCEANVWGKPGLQLYCGSCLAQYFSKQVEASKTVGTIKKEELVRYELVPERELLSIRVSDA